MDILGPHSISHDHIYTPDLTLLYPVILCNLTLERIRHKLLTSGLIRRNTCHPAYNTYMVRLQWQWHITARPVPTVL